MELIGQIRRLQVQTDRLKTGAKPRQRYEPGPIRTVDGLRLSALGVVGLTDGQELLDVHHADHPRTRHRQGMNGISVNFTTHYIAMQARFGPHLASGVAGENMLVETERLWHAEELAGGLVVYTRGDESVRLGEILVAAPCEPFSRFALELEISPPAAMMKETLRFLDGGMRGFYARLLQEAAAGAPSAEQSAIIQVGDPVYVLPS